MSGHPHRCQHLGARRFGFLIRRATETPRSATCPSDPRRTRSSTNLCASCVVVYRNGREVSEGPDWTFRDAETETDSQTLVLYPVPIPAREKE